MQSQSIHLPKCIIRKGKNNTAVKSPSRHYINQMIKVKFTGNIHHCDVPQCDALRRAHHLSDIFSNNIRIQSNNKETLDRLILWDCI